MLKRLFIISTLFEITSKTSEKLGISGVITILIWYAFLLSILISKVNCGDGNFCYEEVSCGPSNWGDTCPVGAMQSPINLESSKAKKIAKSVSLILNRDYALPQTFYLLNNGHTVKLYLNPEGTSTCLIKGNGFLPNEPYYFYQLHFHWGPHDFVGSEHYINGQSFPLELHMIHRQVADDSKFAVLGILFKISEFDNPALSSIIQNLPLVRNYTGNLVPAPANSPIILKNLLPKKVKVFRYHGSLTTPPCSEGIIWTVFDDFQTVSKNQVMELRKILGADQRPIRMNFRPLQQTFTGQRKTIYYMKTMLPTPMRSQG